MSSDALPSPRSPGVQAAATLRPMVKADIPFVTEEHLECFPENVMGRLGRPFLRRYYATFLDTPYGVATIAESGGRPCGFLVGILDTRAHRKLLVRRHVVPLGGTVLLGTLLHPQLACRLFARRICLWLQRRRRGHHQTEAQAEVAKVAVLSHVATVGNKRGAGVGRALVIDFVQVAKASGADRVSLATLDGANGAGPFYDRQGWHLQARHQTFDGRWIRLYDLELHADA